MMKPVMLACSAGLLLTACATDRTEYSSTYSDGYTSGSIQEGSGAQSGWQQSAGTRTTQQEYTQQQQRYGTGQQYQGQQAYSGQTGQSQQMQGDQVVIPLHEEQLRVGTRTVDAGTVTIRKIVTTETVNQPVELRRERLVIDRQGGGAQFGSTQQQQQQGQFRAQAGTQGGEIQGQAQFSEPAGAAPGQQQQQQNWASGSGAAFQEQTYTIQLREEQPLVEKNVVQTGQVVARKTSETQRQNVQQQVRREDVRLDQGSARNVEIRGNINASGQIREPAGAERQDQQQLDSEARMERELEIREPAGAQRDEQMRYETETEIRTESGIQSQQQGVPVRQGRGAFEDFREGSGTRGGAAELRGLDQRSDR